MTYEQYREEMRELGRLMHMDPLKITPSELAQIDGLAIRCEAYEKEHFPIEKPTPEEAEAFRREQERVALDELECRAARDPRGYR